MKKENYSKGNRFFIVKIIILIIGLAISACDKKTEHYISYVNPMIGTGGHGHTFPGATTPFGMVQLSPSNDFKAWDWCSGYHYSDTVLKGFAHTHISGAGLAGLGDILFMPTKGNPTVKPGTEKNPESGYRSRFSHNREKASPGYYRVHLDDYNVEAELTATPRVGIHRYTFLDGGLSNIIIDPTHCIAESVYGTEVEIVSDTEIRGYKHSNGEGGNRKVYFYAKFSKPFKKAVIVIDDSIDTKKASASGHNVKAYVSYNLEKGDAVQVKVALSFVSYEGAYKNLQKEASNLNFDEARKEAEKLWEEKLSRISIGKADEHQKNIFYTGLYHSFISPNIISDVDGNYNIEQKVYHGNEVQYSNYSTWDTYRALHPLFTIIEQKKTAEFVNSLSSREKVAKTGLPYWECVGHDNKCMPGYSPIAIMAEAIVKDIKGIDREDAYKAMYNASFNSDKSSPNYGYNSKIDYLNYGFIPAEITQSVSKTVENAYYDYCVSQAAKKLGKNKDAEVFLKRSLGYRNLFDSSSGYLLPRMSTGKFVYPKMDQWAGLISNYISGNIWGYSTYTPQDMTGIIQLHGGAKKYDKFLDKIFNDTSKMKGEQHGDISGFIGKYGHGDEPSHHMTYLYDYVGQPWKTQKLVHQVMKTQYFDKPNGLINNEDLGQMSAWYIFSSMGFYPVSPVDAKYVFGSPSFKMMQIHLENGNIFTIKAPKVSEKNIYIQSVKLNEKLYDKVYINHSEIMKGGVLEFEMGEKPNFSFGKKTDALPITLLNKQPKIILKACFTPEDPNPDIFFTNQRKITLQSTNDSAIIRYTIDGSEPNANSAIYKNPLTINKYTLLKAACFSDKRTNKLSRSRTFAKEYFKSILADLPENYPKIHYSPVPKRYGKADGSQLIDQRLATMNFSDGRWTGISGKNIEAVIDLGKQVKINEINLRTLTDTHVWIFPPKNITVYTSLNNENFTKIAALNSIATPKNEEKRILIHKLNFVALKTRYVKVKMDNFGPIPAWHGGAGKLPWLFVDEIIIN